MIRYEIREICGDWAIYEVRETETEGGEKCLLILNSRSNAEYVKAILEHEAQYPNAAVPYRPEVAQMSDAECVAVNRLCCTGGHQCHACPLSGSESLEETCFEVERRVNGLAEKYLEHENTIYFHEKLKEITREAAGQTGLSASAQWMIRQQETLQDKAGRLEGWISVDERLPDDYYDYLVVVKHKYEYEDEWEYDVDVGGPALDAGYIDHFWKTYHDWEVGEECHITHWMPLPEPPMMKGGAE
jgi:hypothetical protein